MQREIYSRSEIEIWIECVFSTLDQCDGDYGSVGHFTNLSWLSALCQPFPKTVYQIQVFETTEQKQWTCRFTPMTKKLRYFMPIAVISPLKNGGLDMNWRKAIKNTGVMTMFPATQTESVDVVFTNSAA